MNRQHIKERIEALTEALVLIGIAKAEALSYTTAPATQHMMQLIKLKQEEANRLIASERVLKDMCMELMQQEGRP